MQIHFSTPENKEYFLAEGCHILELCNSSQHPELSIARARLEPQQETELHSLISTAERYIIQQGQGIATIDKQQFIVNTNDVLVIQPNVSQKIFNTGDEDLIFLVICTPRFQPECYQTL